MGLKKRRKKKFTGYSVPEAETVMMDNSKTGGLLKVFLVVQILFAVGLAVRQGDRQMSLGQENNGDVGAPVRKNAALERHDHSRQASTDQHRTKPYDGKLQNRPVIGLVTQPLFDYSPGDSGDDRPPYLAASYVKLVEAAGARPAVIFHNATYEELEKMFHSVNAILFPGGKGGKHGRLDQDDPYFQIGKKIVRLAEQANDKGDYFSLHFTCLGFELLIGAITSNCSCLQPTDSENVASKLDLNWDEVRASRMFASRGVINGTAYAELMSTEALAMMYHMWGLYVEDFSNNKVLSEYLRALSTSKDQQGRTYVSTVEAREYPFFATQWHPEKNAFEWRPDSNIPHSPNAVAVSNFFAQLLGGQARLSRHAFEEEGVLNRKLVYNWPPVFSAAQGGSFEEMYIFV